MKLLHHAHADAELDAIDDRVLTFRAFPLSQATCDQTVRTYDLVLFDRGLAHANEDPDDVDFVPDLLLRFNDTYGVSPPEGVVRDPYEHEALDEMPNRAARAHRP